MAASQLPGVPNVDNLETRAAAWFERRRTVLTPMLSSSSKESTYSERELDVTDTYSLAGWTPHSAFREFLQNFLDAAKLASQTNQISFEQRNGVYHLLAMGETFGTISVDLAGKKPKLTLSQRWGILGRQTLNMGCDKTEEAQEAGVQVCGGHGEGLKMALLILAKSKVAASVVMRGETWTTRLGPPKQREKITGPKNLVILAHRNEQTGPELTVTLTGNGVRQLLRPYICYLFFKNVTTFQCGTYTFLKNDDPTLPGQIYIYYLQAVREQTLQQLGLGLSVAMERPGRDRNHLEVKDKNGYTFGPERLVAKAVKALLDSKQGLTFLDLVFKKLCAKGSKLGQDPGVVAAVQRALKRKHKGKAVLAPQTKGTKRDRTLAEGLGYTWVPAGSMRVEWKMDDLIKEELASQVWPRVDTCPEKVRAGLEKLLKAIAMTEETHSDRVVIEFLDLGQRKLLADRLTYARLVPSEDYYKPLHLMLNSNFLDLRWCEARCDEGAAGMTVLEYCALAVERASLGIFHEEVGVWRAFRAFQKDPAGFQVKSYVVTAQEELKRKDARRPKRQIPTRGRRKSDKDGWHSSTASEDEESEDDPEEEEEEEVVEDATADGMISDDEDAGDWAGGDDSSSDDDDPKQADRPAATGSAGTPAGGAAGGELAVAVAVEAAAVCDGAPEGAAAKDAPAAVAAETALEAEAAPKFEPPVGGKAGAGEGVGAGDAMQVDAPELMVHRQACGTQTDLGMERLQAEQDELTELRKGGAAQAQGAGTAGQTQTDLGLADIGQMEEEVQDMKAEIQEFPQRLKVARQVSAKKAAEEAKREAKNKERRVAAKMAELQGLLGVGAGGAEVVDIDDEDEETDREVHTRGGPAKRAVKVEGAEPVRGKKVKLEK